MDAIISGREGSQRTTELSAPADEASVYVIAAQSVQSASLIPQQLELRRADAANQPATLYKAGYSRALGTDLLHRLAAQDTALSRRRHRFESGWGC
jgi:hypothetical protein